MLGQLKADLVQKGEVPIAYAADFPDFPERWADLVDKLLTGTKVADIPIPQPAKFIFAINLKTAKSLGVEIPASLLASADVVIE